MLAALSAHPDMRAYSNVAMEDGFKVFARVATRGLMSDPGVEQSSAP